MKTGTIKLTGYKAIAYVQQLGGSIGLKINRRDFSTVGGWAIRDIDLDEAKRLAITEPSSVYFMADVSHVDHETIMKRISQ